MTMLCCCEWQGVIDAMPCLIKGLFWLIGCSIFVVKVLKPIVEKLIINCDERKRREKQFKQERFWKYIQLSQIDKKAEIKEKADELAQNMVKGKFNEKLRDLDDELKDRELAWYKKIIEEKK